MSLVPGLARHSTHMVRSAQALPADGGGGTTYDHDPADDTWNTGEGESTSYLTWFDSSKDADGAVVSRADCNTRAKASVQGRTVRALWVASQYCVVNEPGNSATAHEEGFCRAERRFFAENTEDLPRRVSGKCSLDTTKLSFSDLPEPDDFNLTLKARVQSSHAESYIEADFVRNTNIWIVKYQYILLDGTTSRMTSGTYNRTGLDSLSASEDRIYWSHLLPFAGNDIRADAYVNKSDWDGNWQAKSDQITHAFLVGSRTASLSCQAVTEVDSSYVDRPYPTPNFPPS